MAAHSKLGASSMYRWSACPGSVKLSKDIPSVSSSYAEEGTKAHELAATLLEKGGECPSDMKDSVGVYVDLVKSMVKKTTVKMVEVRLNLESVFEGMFGTADCILYQPEEKLLQVMDYKHGAGVFVDVVNNEQLMYYGLGALLSIDKPVTQVELIVVQPRCEAEETVRKWRFDAVDLIDFRADLIAYAKKTSEPDAPLVSGDHCRFCPAAHVCPELQKNAMTAAKNDFAPVQDLNQIADYLNMIPRIEGWIKAVREYAYREAERGRMVPGFKLVEKRATRKWVDEEKVFTKVKASGIKELIEESIKSPAQAEKVLGKAKFSQMFGDSVVSISSGLTLVPDSDSRQAAIADASLDFTPITSLDNLM